MAIDLDEETNVVLIINYSLLLLLDVGRDKCHLSPTLSVMAIRFRGWCPFPVAERRAWLWIVDRSIDR